MAKQLIKRVQTEIPNAKLIENHKGIIIVKKKIRFVNNGEKKKCDNCGNLHSSKTIYKTFEGKKVGICYFCNKKIHNSTATNPRFRKDEILNPQSQEK